MLSSLNKSLNSVTVPCSRKGLNEAKNVSRELALPSISYIAMWSTNRLLFALKLEKRLTAIAEQHQNKNDTYKIHQKKKFHFLV